MEFITDLFVFDSQSPLLFTQPVFWFFLLAVLIVFALTKNKPKPAHFWLLLVSYYFYYKSSGNFVVLLATTTLISYCCANAISVSKSVWERRLFLSLAITVVVCFLLYFKYTYFIVDLINTCCNSRIYAQDYLSLFVNNSFGTSFSVDKIVLPVGISFFSFQAISYVVDVYKKRISGKTSFLDFAFYLSFFPQLVAGPIVRADNFLPQMNKPYSLSKKDFNIAFFFILNGLVKKIFVSDYISLNFVDRVFASPDTFSGVENALACYAYTLQIYCDFSAYTDIAISVSLLFGFHLPANFNSPYKAISISDFWHRWHISLSTWLRDYIYIPLGGNKKGKLRQYLNLMTTMLIGGLWHGANLKFVLWGGAHGLLLVADKIGEKVTRPLRNNKLFCFFSWLVCFHIITFLWIFFRAEDASTALQIIEKYPNSTFPISALFFLPIGNLCL